jgi:mono/diheme cytochrome c family protein
MPRAIALLGALAVIPIGAAFAQAQSTSQQTQKPAAQAAAPAAAPYVIPPEDAKKPNPVKLSEASVAEGKRIYGYDCAMCHGETGDGKGDLAGDMKLTLKDFRDPASLKDLTDGEMFYIITKGKGQMPGEGTRQTPEEVWNMVNYIKSLAKKTAAAKTK